MLNTRNLMVLSSICLAIGGAACLFAPVELLSLLDMSGGSALIVQILGALYLGSAAANWAARGSMIGGIYARPLSLANFVHFVVGALVLINGMPADALNVAHIAATVVYALFAVLFALMLYGRLGSRPAS